MTLPKSLDSLFWDCDPSALSFEAHYSFIIRRILDRGNWDSITWLRREIGDEALKDWFLLKRGGGLDPRKLRFWGLILNIPSEDVDQWVREARQTTWHARLNR